MASLERSFNMAVLAAALEHWSGQLPTRANRRGVMNSNKIGDGAKTFEALTSSELTSVAGGNTIAILGVPFLIGVLISGSTMNLEQWFNKYVD
jgi:hypothetical protein